MAGLVFGIGPRMTGENAAQPNGGGGGGRGGGPGGPGGGCVGDRGLPQENTERRYKIGMNITDILTHLIRLDLKA